MSTNIVFYNCQGIRPKRKELELSLKENVINVNALNETFHSKSTISKSQITILSEMTVPTGQKGSVAFLVKHGLVVNKEYRNDDFNIIADNEALLSISNFLITKPSLWQPITAQMETRTSHSSNH